MSEIFSYQIDNQFIQLYKPTSYTLGISGNISKKFHINQIELARYILYYSQESYKETEHLDYSFFKNIEIENLTNFFCDYINSDEKFLKNFSIQKVFNIETGVELIIKKQENFGIKMGTITTIGSIFLESNSIWIDAIHGNFNQAQSERIKKKWEDFRNLILPKLPINNDSEILANKVIHFLNEKADGFLRNSEKISLLIEGLEIAKLWIPSQLISEVSKEFLKLDSVNIGLRYLPKLVFKLIDRNCIEKMKTDMLDNEWLVNRSKIINEMFDNLYAKNYHSVISLGLSQIDYLVFEIVLYFRKSLNNNYTTTKVIEILLDKLEDIKGKTKVEDFMPFSQSFENGLRIIQLISLTNYLSNHLFKKYDFDKDICNDIDLNRHAILHGKANNYGTYENALRIIMLIDDLLYTFKHYIVANRDSA